MAPTAAQDLDALVTPTIAVLMYAMFLPFLEQREGLSNKRFMSALLIANFVLIPLLVLGLTRGLTDHSAILVGTLLVLLTPCIDYVVVFTHIGKGDSRGILAATPILLLLQFVLLPLYLTFMLGGQFEVVISIGPFVETFLVLIVAPLLLAVITSALVKRSRIVGGRNAAWALLPVPAMAAVLITVVGSQISSVARDIDRLAPAIPVYIGFMLLAPLIGALASKAFKLPSTTARAVTFSSSTRNSLVVLPLALALPEEIRGLAAAAVITQTLIELIGEMIYIRAIPALVWRKKSQAVSVTSQVCDSTQDGPAAR